MSPAKQPPDLLPFSLSLLNLFLLLTLLLAAPARADDRALSVLPFPLTAPASFILSDLDLPPPILPAARPIVPHTPLHSVLVLDEPDVDTVFTFAFAPEPGRNVSDYTVHISCSNPAVLAPSDVMLAPPLALDSHRANYSLAITFARSVGRAALTVSFRVRDVATVYASVTVSYLVCGISFFHIRPDGLHLLPDRHLAFATTRAATAPVVLRLLVQYPDGSSSDRPPADFATLPPWSDLRTSLHGAPLLPTTASPICLHGHASPGPRDDSPAVLKPPCPFGLTPFSNADHPPPTLTMHLKPTATGTLAFRFVWDSFLRGTTIESVYETALTMSVTGVVPPVVRSVAPAGPFRRVGGQVLVCEVGNVRADSHKHFELVLGGHVLLPFVRRPLGNSSDVVLLSFHTPPGNGSQVSWDLRVSTDPAAVAHSCPWGGPPPRFVFSYVSHVVSLRELKPTTVSSGGGIVICLGHFPAFNASHGSGDAVLLDGHPVASDDIISTNDTHCIFRAPPLRELDIPHRAVSCVVRIRGVKSNPLSLKYSGLAGVTVDVGGATLLSIDGSYSIPVCPGSALAALNSTVQFFALVRGGADISELRFEWMVRERTTRRQAFSATGGPERQTVLFSTSDLRVGVLYDVVVSVSDSLLGIRVSASVPVRVVQTNALGVGLNFRRERMIAWPLVDTRISAMVWRSAQCRFAKERLAYAWTFGGKTTTLSYEGNVGDLLAIGPRRFGREFVVPRRLLRYGKHKVAVKVYYIDQPDVSGVAHGELSVVASPLVAIIGSGESYVHVSCLKDLVMNGSLSHDPDVHSNRHSGLLYEWGCEYSTRGGVDFTSVAECPSVLFPEGIEHADSFIIQVAHLKALQSDASSVFVRYSLTVRKKHSVSTEIRSSITEQQVVEIRVTQDVLATSGNVAVTGPEGLRVLRQNVPYFDTVVLSPQADATTSWKFRLKAPGALALTFLSNSSNVLQLPGYYDPSNPMASQGALGLREGALTPGTPYLFEIVYQSSRANASSRVEVSLQTMDKPDVQFVSLIPKTGTSDTIFSAVATATTDDTFFKYHFYLRLADGSEICVDGCSGERHVWFRIPTPGRYTLRVTLSDARGQFVLASATSTQVITISSVTGPTSTTKVAAALTHAVHLGDHAAFGILCLTLTAHLASSPPSLASSATTHASNSTLRLRSLVRNTGPCAATAADYVTIAHALARLPPGLPDAGSVEDLCVTLSHAVHDVPRLERLSVQTILNATLSALTSHARALDAGGSARRPLRNDVNEALLAVGELTVSVWANATARHRPCAFVSHSTVGTIVDVSITTACKQSDTRALRTGQTAVEWCEEAFDQTGRTCVVVGEFQQDFVSYGLRRTTPLMISSESDKDVAMNTSQGPAHGTLVQARVVGATGGCARLRQTVRPVASLYGAVDGDVLCERATGVEYVRRKMAGEALGDEAYGERELVTLSGGVGDGTRPIEVVSSLASGDGLFSTRWRKCVRRRVWIVGIGGPWWFPVLGVCGALVTTACAIWGGVRLLTPRRVVSTETWGVAYIERDVYGRNPFAVEHQAVDEETVGDVHGTGEMDEEEVVFESPRAAGTAAAIGRDVGDGGGG